MVFIETHSTIAAEMDMLSVATL